MPTAWWCRNCLWVGKWLCNLSTAGKGRQTLGRWSDRENILFRYCMQNWNCLIKTCVIICDMNSALGSVVPLAMFCLIVFFSNFFKTKLDKLKMDEDLFFFSCFQTLQIFLEFYDSSLFQKRSQVSEQFFSTLSCCKKMNGLFYVSK